MSKVLINSAYTNISLCLNNHIFTLILIHIWFHHIHSYFIKTANTFVTLSFYSYFKFILFMNPLLLSNVLSNNGFSSIICYWYHNHKVIACFLSYRLFANLVSLSLITTLVVIQVHTHTYRVHSISRYMIQCTFHAYKVYWITTVLWYQL